MSRFIYHAVGNKLSNRSLHNPQALTCSKVSQFITRADYSQVRGRHTIYHTGNGCTKTVDQHAFILVSRTHSFIDPVGRYVNSIDRITEFILCLHYYRRTGGLIKQQVGAGYHRIVHLLCYLAQHFDILSPLQRTRGAEQPVFIIFFKRPVRKRQGSAKYERDRSEERRVGKECRSRWSPY